MTTQRTIRRGLVGALAASLCAGAACEDSTLEPERVPLDQVITLQRTRADALPHNAIDTLVARLPEDADPRSVVFTTSAGRFMENEARTVTVSATHENGNAGALVARVRLRADTTFSTSAVVSAAVNQYVQYVTVPFTR